MASSSKSVARATSKRGQVTTAKTPIGWKRWAKKQKNVIYNEPAFQASRNTIDSYLTSYLLWNEEEKKPADISHQLPYSQLVTQWETIKKGGRPPPASMMEAIRILNSLAIPDNIVDMLKEAGWDAEKCCNPKLPRDQRKLGRDSQNRSVASKTRASPHLEPKGKTPPQLFLSRNIPMQWPRHQKSQHLPISLLESHHRYLIMISSRPRKRLRCLPYSVKTAASTAPTFLGMMLEKVLEMIVPGFNRGGLEVGMEPRVDPIIIGAAVDNTQPADITKSPKMTKLTNSENSSPGSAHEIESSKSTSFKCRKRTSRKEMKRAIDAVSNSLTVMTASHSVKLQDQASRLSEHSEQFDVHSGQLQEQTNQLHEHADRLHNHSNQLQKQELALEQLRRDNQALRDCLQGVLLPLAQAVNTLHKSSKADKRMLKSTKKRAERELEEFKSADKTTKVLERNLTHLRCLLGAVEDRHKGMNEA
ncbi:LOW QUALITY PROTEIN: hypothetical protein Ct61P_13026 [Colletotrichum tofieldiae]|nr:LOW QUALITY PROTEIN: hypothetical protein Ct61P_13026 [Colletotrichum tofieldiae]